jgi:hypothetical protein
VERPINGAAAKDGLVDPSAVVHQATGMISVQLEVPLAEALSRLHAYGIAHGRPVTEVAAEVVARRLGFGGTEK